MKTMPYVDQCNSSMKCLQISRIQSVCLTSCVNKKIFARINKGNANYPYSIYVQFSAQNFANFEIVTFKYIHHKVYKIRDKDGKNDAIVLVFSLSLEFWHNVKIKDTNNVAMVWSQMFCVSNCWHCLPDLSKLPRF